MGVKTMTSMGGNGGQQSQFQNLARQGSLYSLTLNEVQSHLGEPLSSMNLDELLKSVFAGEVNQSGAMSAENAAHFASTSVLQTHGSINMPRALSKKTVDEVWREIQQMKAAAGQHPERQLTLGEITLEDFLIKAGIVAEGSSKKSNEAVGNVGELGGADPASGLQDFAQGAPVHWLHYRQHQNMLAGYGPGPVVAPPLGVSSGPMLDSLYSDGPMAISSPTMGALSDPQTTGRKRGALGEMADKLMERRQKRMIKNRESAARSRARKQAYTNELENKVTRLEEENEKLKKQKEAELRFPPPLGPKYQLRRTSSALF